MKLKTQIRFFSSLLASIVLVVASIVLLFYIPSILKENAIKASQALNQQTLFIFDNLFTSLGTMSQFPIVDEEVNQILSKEYSAPDEKLERYRDIDVVNAKLYTHMFYDNFFVSAVMLHSLQTDAVYSKYIGQNAPQLEQVTQQDWYQQVSVSDGRVIYFPLMRDEIYGTDKEVISVGRLIKQPGSEKDIGILRIDVFADRLYRLWENILTTQSDFVLVNQDNALLYSSLTDQRLANVVAQTNSFSNLEQKVVLEDEKYLLLETISQTSDNKMYALISTQFISEDAYRAMFIIFALAAISLLIIFFLSELISIRTMRPIQNLNGLMKQVRQGNFEVRSQQVEGGDFGEICQSFNHMLDEMQDLILRNQQKERARFRAEYQALQAQISPHFVMNTLNSIKWMAYIQGNQSIESSLDALANLIRFAIRNNDEFILLEVELQQMEYYLHILSLRYSNRFQITLTVEEELKKCYTLKYILQPIVENSVFHGFAHRQLEEHISIRIVSREDCIVYEVSDNGVGISEEKLQQLLTHQEEETEDKINRIGLYNIHRRIQMNFGESYGVTIQSKQGQGTRVVVEIPRIEEMPNEADFNS